MHNASELYFEESDIENFACKIEELYPETVYVNRLMTLFGDRTLGENEDPSEVFGNMWSDYGFSISNENTLLISIVIYDPDFNQTFTGHTGVLIKQAEDIYLYVEKLAFEQPYQAILVSDTDQLFKLLADREEYYGSEGEAGPYVYVNGVFISELKTWK